MITDNRKNVTNQSWDGIWEDIFRSREWGRWPGEDVVRGVSIEFAKSQKNTIKILEIGCGTGANLWFLAKEGYQVYGADGSETAIKKSQEKLDREAPNWSGQLCVTDITTLPYEDNTFDMVIDCEAVSANSFENAKKIYAEAARVLKPQGTLLSKTFAKGTWGDTPGFREGTVSEGPLEGKGLIRFTELNEVPQLLKEYKVMSVDLYARSIDGDLDGKVIKEWLIRAKKI